MQVSQSFQVHGAVLLDAQRGIGLAAVIGSARHSVDGAAAASGFPHCHRVGA